MSEAPPIARPAPRPATAASCGRASSAGWRGASARRRSRRSAARPRTACRARRCCSTRAGRGRRAQRRGALVARARARPGRDVPVFPSYDLERQFRVMRAGRRARRVPVPRVRLARARSGAARRAVLRDGARRRAGAARHHARTPSATAGSRRRRPSSRRGCRTRSVAVLAELSTRSTGRRRRRFGFLALDASPAPRRCAATSADQRGFYDWVRRGRHPLAADRARLRVARRELAAARGRRPSSLGRLAHRQHHVSRLRARGGARLGDGRARAARSSTSGWMIFLHRVLRRSHPERRHAGHAGPAAPRGRGGDYETPDGLRAARSRLVHAATRALRHGIVMFRIARRMVALRRSDAAARRGRHDRAPQDARAHAGRRVLDVTVDLELAGRSVIVTGGSGGIGRGLVLGLRGRRARTSCSRARDAAQSQRGRGRVRRGSPGSRGGADATSPTRPRCARWSRDAESASGAIDVLVNNAGGVAYPRPFAREAARRAATGSSTSTCGACVHCTRAVGRGDGRARPRQHRQHHVELGAGRRGGAAWWRTTPAPRAT